MATYTELATLKTNSAFASRVEIAVAKFARYIMDESPNTPNHEARFAWAVNAVSNPGSVGAGLLPSVVLDDAVSAGAADQTTITDAQIQSAVEGAVNRFLNTEGIGMEGTWQVWTASRKLRTCPSINAGSHPVSEPARALGCAACFEFTDAEVARIQGAIQTWDSYGTNADRRWLQPLLEMLFPADLSR